MVDSKRVPHNTSLEARESPMVMLSQIVVSGVSRAILHQEEQGQQSFVGSDTLPTDMGRHGLDAKAILEAFGVKFLGVVSGDDLFQYVELPQGWKKEATSESMFSKLIDDRGRERAVIFYKAAFYDRSAHLALSCRFRVVVDYDRFNKEQIGVASVTDSGKVVHTTEKVVRSDGENRWSVIDKANDLAVEWLDTNYPDWKSPSAYWD